MVFKLQSRRASKPVARLNEMTDCAVYQSP